MTRTLDRSAVRSAILDQFGKPFEREMTGEARELNRDLARMRAQIVNIKAKYDAAQTVIGNERHWNNVDYYDPHNSSSLSVRRKLRARSRYEIIENNPYLKGVILSIVNDFIGSGPKLQITDKRLGTETKRLIERRWQKWSHGCRLRQKLWRMRLAKIVDGESFAFAYTNLRQTDPVKLCFQVIECDRVSSEMAADSILNSPPVQGMHEIDGVRFDDYENPISYYLLNQHPGGNPNNYPWVASLGGRWINARFVAHWFRQDRGWLRGIPETVTSLPLCALLRRYTIAVIRAAELAADFSAVIESEGPTSPQSWTDEHGNMITDEPFDVFPIEFGMITNLPWHYKLKQLEAEQPTTMYDRFVDSLLREIVRPLLVPFNLAAGSSEKSNMASGVLDSQLYKCGQWGERWDCNEVCMDPILTQWWLEASLIDDYFFDPAIREQNPYFENPSLRFEPPEHRWRWDRIGIDHTDPLKCAEALKTLHDKQFITDRDIQEEYYNRDIEDWREDIAEEMKFRELHNMLTKDQQPEPEPQPRGGVA